MQVKDLHAALPNPGALINAAASAVSNAASAAKGAVGHLPHLPGAKHTSSANTGSNGSESKISATAKVFAAVQGHWMSSCLMVMLQLRIPDILMQQQQQQGTTTAEAPAGSGVDHPNGEQILDADGSMSMEQIAQACGATSPTATSHLYKVLRVMAQYELLDELPGKRFAPNQATAELVQGEVPSLGHMASHLVNAPKWDAWKVLPQAVQQGKTAFVLAHGMDVYQYGELPEHAAYGEEFMKAMSYFTRHSLSGGSTSLKDAYDWTNARVILDVGGGRGELLSSVMSWAGAGCKGLLLDRQMVINSIDIPGMFEAKGVTNAASRLTLMAEDVRQPFPEQAQKAKVDTLLMKHFLSAFNDEDAVLIVRHCKEVLVPGGAILLLQTLVPEAGDRNHNTCEDGVAPGLFAIEILAQCPGGAWRTLSEWQEIFKQAGMQLRSNTTVGCNMNLMVWRDESSRW